jgi:hypothetical protein
LASIAEGRQDREKFGSHKHKKLDSKAHSTTNAEKSRKKVRLFCSFSSFSFYSDFTDALSVVEQNFLMIAHSRDVVSKKRQSLHRKSNKLRSASLPSLPCSSLLSLLTLIFVSHSSRQAYEVRRKEEERRARLDVIDSGRRFPSLSLVFGCIRFFNSFLLVLNVACLVRNDSFRLISFSLKMHLDKERET